VAEYAAYGGKARRATRCQRYSEAGHPASAARLVVPRPPRDWPPHAVCGAAMAGGSRADRSARITRNRRAPGEIALPISRKPTGGQSPHRQRQKLSPPVSLRRMRAFLHAPHEPVSRPVRTVLPDL